jgi:hypothetical protein
MKHRDGAGLSVLAFFLCFFFLFSSGRIASQDAGQQLQVAVLLATTGALGQDARDAGPADASWVRAPNGRFYQAHDIGNIVLMLPGAWLGARLSAASDSDDILNPPALSRAGASLACAAIAALGCFWMFRLFSCFWPVRTAFLLSVAFPATTIFMAYSRAAWDVLGGCCFMCGVLYYSARLLRGDRIGASALMLAATTALVCSFRFSLAPFLVIGAGVVFVAARQRLTLRLVLSSACVFCGVIFPSLVYNFVRTGSPVRPATATAQYLDGVNALTGNMLYGLYGLFLSPNRGIFLFSPILLLAVVTVIKWERLDRELRQLLSIYGAAAACYVLLISKMANWGAFGWGPRYLMPVLPLMFLAAACGLMLAWPARRRAVLALAALSALLTVPPAIVNWHLATTSFAGAADPDAPTAAQQRAAWSALVRGVQGQALPVPPNAAADSLRATTSEFPDLFLWRLARISAMGVSAAVIAVAAALWIGAVTARRILGVGPPDVRSAEL